jgi:hypothetical protein
MPMGKGYNSAKYVSPAHRKPEEYSQGQGVGFKSISDKPPSARKQIESPLNAKATADEGQGFLGSPYDKKFKRYSKPA